MQQFHCNPNKVACQGRAALQTGLKHWCLWSAECGFKSMVMTLVSLIKTPLLLHLVDGMWSLRSRMSCKVFMCTHNPTRFYTPTSRSVEQQFSRCRTAVTQFQCRAEHYTLCLGTSRWYALYKNGLFILLLLLFIIRQSMFCLQNLVLKFNIGNNFIKHNTVIFRTTLSNCQVLNYTEH